MVTLLLAIIAVSSFLTLTGGLVVYAKANRTYQEAANTLTYIFEAGDQNNPSLFVQTINEFAEGTAQRVGIHVQAAIKGSIGGTMKGVNAALENEAIENDPSLAVASALPKSLRKNPIAMIGLQLLMQKALAGQTVNNKSIAPNNGHNSPVKFNL